MNTFKTRVVRYALAMAFAGLTTGCDQASTVDGENTFIDGGDTPLDAGDTPLDSGGAPLDGGVISIDGGDTVDVGRRLADGGGTATEDAQTDTGNGGQGDGLYQPDNGPTHELGLVVDVCSETEVLAAIANASPGDVITVCPGSYDFKVI